MKMEMTSATTSPWVPFNTGSGSAFADEMNPVTFSVRSAEHANLSDAVKEASAGSAGTRSDIIDSDILERDRFGSQMRLFL